MVGFKHRTSGLAAGAAAMALLAAAGAAQAQAQDEGGNLLAWSLAGASVGVCQAGVTCGQPNGVYTLKREQFSAYDVDFNNASVYQDDYAAITNGANFGMAYAAAEAGEGLLGLPVLHAVAASWSPVLGIANPYIGVTASQVTAVQGYTNTSTSNLLIPLNAFQGLVDFTLNNSSGFIGAGLAITTDAILDPTVAGQWSALGGVGQLGQFAAGCGTTGALAFGQTGQRQPGGSPNVQYLPVAATSCIGSDTFTLAPDATFYVWARLGVANSGRGVTNAGNTFNVTIAPEYEDEVVESLAPALALSGGEGLDIPVPSQAVPEPGVWALLIGGFGLAGAQLRRRRLATA